MKIVSAEEMRSLERAAAAGLPYSTMMTRAGQAVADEISRRRDLAGASCLVLVGPGNNGGDGLVAACRLHELGAQVHVYLAKPRLEPDGNLALVRGLSIPVTTAADDPTLARLTALLADADVIVDALLGTGVTRELEEGSVRSILVEFRRSLDARTTDRRRRTEEWAWTMAGLGGPLGGGSERSSDDPFVVSVDLPSGLNSDTGAVDPATPFANLTVTFAHPKRGHVLFPGARRIGELAVADIGIPAELASGIPLEMTTAADALRSLPLRPLGAHKGSFGTAVVVAGSTPYPGAACLAAMATARTGTGIVRLACPASLVPIVAAKMLEVIYLPLPEDELGALGPSAGEHLLQALATADHSALLVGPGLGQRPGTARFVRELLASQRSSPAGFVLDADALNALSTVDEWWRLLPGRCILTPHPGEMARLSKLAVASVEANRWQLAAEKARQWGTVVVLKGAFTVVASPDGRLQVNPFANPGLATAGSGDVLAGAIAGLLAQGLDPFAAATAGAYLHGLAGELARGLFGDAGVIAGDLLPLLPRAIQIVKRGCRKA